MNFTCAICSELFVPSDNIHITSCGHIFHYACVLQWFQRSKSCPQCRNICNEKKLIKVYMNVAESVDNLEDQASLLQKFDDLTLSVREKNEKIKTLEETSSSRAAELSKMKKMSTRMGEQLKDRDITITMYKYQLETLKLSHNYVHDMEDELKHLKEKYRVMSALNRIINSTSEEVDEILALTDDPRALSFLNASLKRELQASECQMDEMRDQRKSIQEDLLNERAKQTSIEDQLKSAEREIYILTQEAQKLKNNTKASKSKEFGSDTSIPNTPDQQAKRKRSDIDLNERTPKEDKIRDILDLDSSHLCIKSCGSGLRPILRTDPCASAAPGKAHSAGPSETNSDLSDSLRLCGAKKRDNLKLEPSIRLATNRKTIQINPHSVAARLKSGQLRKPLKPINWKNRPSEDYNVYFPSAEDCYFTEYNA